MISLARAISFNGLANAFTIAAINGGRHVNPLFAGDTVFAWSEVLDKKPLGHRKDAGALRLRLVATKNLPCGEFPDKDDKGAYPENVILDFDYWAILPRAMTLFNRYRAAVSRGELKDDAAQRRAAEKLNALARSACATIGPAGACSLRRTPPPRGLYIWGDVGRGKSMLMDLFFAEAPIERQAPRPFQRLHGRDACAGSTQERQREGSDDPIPPVARAIAEKARLLCFDEFQVSDVADAMILGRLFEQLFERGVVIVATSNTPPDRLYEGGLNRQLFLPFIAEIKERLEIVELNGPRRLSPAAHVGSQRLSTSAWAGGRRGDGRGVAAR